MNVSWSFDGHTKHSQLMIQSVNHFLCNSHGYQFTYKVGSLNGVLLLRAEWDRSIVHKDKIACVGPLSHTISGMVCINKARDNHRIAAGFGTHCEQFLHNIPVSLSPVHFLESALIIAGLCWIKHWLHLWVCFVCRALLDQTLASPVGVLRDKQRDGK